MFTFLFLDVKIQHSQVLYKLLEDPSLLHLFSEEEGTSWQELPLLGTVCFRLISERFFAHTASPTIQRKTGVEFMTDTSPRISREATPMAILITDGVGKDCLRMVTIFCHHNQNKMEACDALSALCQHDSPEPRVVVVWRYTNTLYIPQGTTRLLYLDISALSRGPTSVQFPLGYLCLQRLLPYSKNEVLLPYKEGGMDSKCTPTPRRFYGKDLKRSTAFLTQYHYQSPHPLSFPLQKKAFRLRRNQSMKDQAKTQPFNECSTIIRQKLN